MISWNGSKPCGKFGEVTKVIPWNLDLDVCMGNKVYQWGHVDTGLKLVRVEHTEMEKEDSWILC